MRGMCTEQARNDVVSMEARVGYVLNMMEYV